MRKKILLVYVSMMCEGNLPIGMAMLYSILKNEYDIKLFDTTFYPKKDFEKLREFREKSLEFKKLDDELPTLNSTDINDDFDNLYNNFKPDLIMVSAVSDCYELALDLIKNVNVPVIFGGIHATIMPDEIISNEKVTHLFRGECEEVLSNLVESILSNKNLNDFQGLWFKENGKIIKNDGVIIVNDLNKLPIPDWTIFDERHYYKPFKGKVYRIGHFELSRGCPYSCTYCINHTLQKIVGYKKHYREKTVDRALEEVKILTKKHNIQIVKFWDENFLGFKKDSKNFLVRYSKEVGLPFMIQTRPEWITEEYAKLLKEAGCVNLSMGIESGNDYIRRNMLKRFVKNEDIIKGFQLCKKHGLRAMAFVLLGLPEETRKEVFDTVELLKACEPSTTSIFLVYPYKGTEIREWFIKHKWLDENEKQKYVDLHKEYIPKNPNFTEEELLALKKTIPIYVHTNKKYYPIIEKAEKDELLFSFLSDIYAKIIHNKE
ncbi:MAG: radical SAM protein [Nanoarchaeota archaeon]